MLVCFVLTFEVVVLLLCCCFECFCACGLLGFVRSTRKFSRQCLFGWWKSNVLPELVHVWIWVENNCSTFFGHEKAVPGVLFRGWNWMLESVLVSTHVVLGQNFRYIPFWGMRKRPEDVVYFIVFLLGVHWSTCFDSSHPGKLFDPRSSCRPTWEPPYPPWSLGRFFRGQTD